MSRKYIAVLILLFIVFPGCKDVQEDHYASGQLKSECEVKDGVKHGKVYTYHENSQIAMDGQYIEGKREGAFKWYYSNGQLEQEVNFQGGKEHGYLKQYYQSGELKGEGAFKNGKQEGIVKYYYKNGMLEKEQEIKHGIQHGYFKSYYPNGQLELDAVLDDGETVYYKDFDEKGELTGNFRKVTIEPDLNSLYTGNMYEFTIKPQGPSFEIHHAEIKIKRKEGETLTTDVTIKLDEELNFAYTPKSSGTYILETFLIDVEATVYVSTKDFVVLEKEGS